MFLPQIAEILADERRQELRRKAARSGNSRSRHPSVSFHFQRVRRRQ